MLLGTGMEKNIINLLIDMIRTLKRRMILMKIRIDFWRKTRCEHKDFHRFLS